MSDGTRNQISPFARIAVSFTIAIIVAGATWLVRHPEDGTRRPASVRKDALRTDIGKQNRIDAHTRAHSNGELHGKITGTFSIAIDNEPTSNPKELRLRAVLTAERALVGHEFSWILPPGYRIISGGASGRVPDLTSGETYEARISVVREPSDPKPIVLHVFKIVDSEPRGQVAQYDETADEQSQNPKTGTGRGPVHDPYLKGETIVQ